jgi:hypothetical protein
MSELFKKLIAALLGSGEILRTLLFKWAESFAEAAKETAGKVDDFAAMILLSILKDDDLWEQFQSLVLLIFGLEKAETPIEDNAEIAAFAERVAAKTGKDVEKVKAALYSLAA